jgi:hypothetical protein
MWKELQEKIAEKNANGSPARVEWSSDGEDGEGTLTEINVDGEYVEFFITDDSPEVGYFTMRSARSVLGISPQEGNDLHIFSHYMGTITILHDT